MSFIIDRSTDRPKQRQPEPRVLYVPASIAWTFTANDGWQLSVDRRGSLDMDRLCDRYDETEGDVVRQEVAP